MNSFRKRLSALAATIALVMLIVAWIAFAPTQFGGQTVYVIVSGNSMEPGFHRGDLILLRQADSYQVGDIATYRHPTIGPVIHRIVAEADGRFTLKGDNNAWLDSFQPTQAEMIGKFWTFVPSVGKIVEQLRRPWTMALLTAFAGTVIAISVLAGQSRPRGMPRRRRTATGKQTAVNQTSGAGKADLFFVLATLAVASLMLGLFAFTRPLTRKVFDDVPYAHSGRFSYSAVAPPGLYDGNTVATGAPVFRRLITRVNVVFDYHFQAEQARDIAGTTRLDAVLASNNGWQRTFELQGETSFRGARAQLAGVLDLGRLQAVLDGVEQQTGVASTQYRLSLAPTVVVSGTLAGQALQETFAPQLVFLLDPLQMQLAPDQGRAGETTDPLKPTQRQTLRQAREIPNTISLLSLSLPVSIARSLSAIGLALTLFSIAIVGLVVVRRAHANEAAQIQSRYNALLVNVRDSDLLAGRRLVQVAKIDDLARIAERGGRMILHEAAGDEHRYFIQEEDVVYHYRSAGAAAPLAASAGKEAGDVA